LPSSNSLASDIFLQKCSLPHTVAHFGEYGCFPVIEKYGDTDSIFPEHCMHGRVLGSHLPRNQA